MTRRQRRYWRRAQAVGRLTRPLPPGRDRSPHPPSPAAARVPVWACPITRPLPDRAAGPLSRRWLARAARRALSRILHPPRRACCAARAARHRQANEVSRMETLACGAGARHRQHRLPACASMVQGPPRGSGGRAAGLVAQVRPARGGRTLRSPRERPKRPRPREIQPGTSLTHDRCSLVRSAVLAR